MRKKLSMKSRVVNNPILYQLNHMKQDVDQNDLMGITIETCQPEDLDDYDQRGDKQKNAIIRKRKIMKKRQQNVEIFKI